MHFSVADPDELARGLELTAARGGAPVTIRELVAPERLPLFELARDVQSLHCCDPTVPDGFLPARAIEANFGHVLAVSGGMGVGYLLLFDSSGRPGEPIDPRRPLRFDELSNVWVAHASRRRGIATSMLRFARARYPLTELRRPFTAAGDAWIRRAAPSLVSPPGRNDPCSCGSGRKFKRCCA